MTDVEAIRRVLRARLLTAEGVIAEKIAMENRTFDPTNLDTYFREGLSVDSHPLTANERIMVTGTYLVTIWTKLGTGTEIIGELQRRILAAFAPNTQLEMTGPNPVTIVRVEPVSGSRGDLGRYMNGVRVTWRTFTNL